VTWPLVVIVVASAMSGTSKHYDSA